MKKYLALALCGCGLLTGCSGGKDYPFQPKLLPNEVFEGYWAMLPEQEVYNTLKFEKDGNVTLYRFTCKSPTEFVEKESEKYKLETIGKNKMYAHWNGGFSMNTLFIKYFELTFDEELENGKFFRLTQYIPAPVDKYKRLVYAKVDSPKPLCSYPKTENKVKKYSK